MTSRVAQSWGNRRVLPCARNHITSTKVLPKARLWILISVSETKYFGEERVHYRHIISNLDNGATVKAPWFYRKMFVVQKFHKNRYFFFKKRTDFCYFRMINSPFTKLTWLQEKTILVELKSTHFSVKFQSLSWYISKYDALHNFYY